MSLILQLNHANRYSVSGYVFEKGKPTRVTNESIAKYLRGLQHPTNGHALFSVIPEPQKEVKKEPVVEKEISNQVEAEDQVIRDSSFKLKESVYNEEASNKSEMFEEIPEEEDEGEFVVEDFVPNSPRKRGRPKKS